MKELILYVARASEGDPNFGAVKLNKILFFSDFLAFLKRRKAITDQPYFALREGPAPRRLVPIRDEMVASGEIEIQRVTWVGLPNAQQRVKALREPNRGAFEEGELEIADEAINYLKGKNGSQCSDLTHQFWGWKSAIARGERTEIPYTSVLFDAEGFIGFESPPLPQSVVEELQQAERELKAAHN